MKKIPSFYSFYLFAALVLFAAVCSWAADAELQQDGNNYFVKMPRYETQTLAVPSTVSSFTVKIVVENEDEILEENDVVGSYPNNSAGTLRIEAPSGYLLRVEATTVSTESDYDYLYIIDGSTSQTLWSGDGNNLSVPTLVTEENKLNISFTSDNSGVRDGINLTVTTIGLDQLRSVTLESAENGDWESVSRNVLPGQSVSLTATPSMGYYLSNISVVDSENNNVSVTLEGYTISFVMPENSVTVTPTFAPITFGDDGCLTGGLYFHLECAYQSCTVSQLPTSSPVTGKDFTCWSDLAAAYASERGGTDWWSLSIGSHLSLGGYNSATGTCVMGEFAHFDVVRQFNGRGYTIDGFCDITTGAAGFINNVDPDLDFRSCDNVKFTNAYVQGDSAGVLGAGHTASFTDVTIDRATVIGNAAGAIAGRFHSSTSYQPQLSAVTVKNSTIIAKRVNASNPSDSLYAGALVGSGGARGSAALQNNTIQVDESASASDRVSVGGAFGVYWNGRDDVSNPQIQISDATLRNTSSATEVNMGGFAGLHKMGSATTELFSKVAVDADLRGGTNVGGIFGQVDLTGFTRFYIRNTYSTGHIAGSGNVGYIIGLFNDPDMAVGAIANNYHFSTTDAVFFGIGNLFTDVDDWINSAGYIHGNIRNAVDAMDVTGAMGFYGYELLGDTTIYFFPYIEDDVAGLLVGARNGVADESDMKSDMFAALLNRNTAPISGISAYNDPDYSTWSRAEGVNKGLPFFAKGSYLPNHVVALQVDGLSEVLPGYASYGFRNWFMEADRSASTIHEAIVSYTDASGHLSYDDAAQLNSFKSALAAVANQSDNAVMFVDESKNVITPSTSTFSRYQTLQLLGTESYSIVYNYCTTADDCLPFEDVTTKTFIFMTPKVSTLATNDPVEYQILPYVVDLGGTDDAPSSTQLTITSVEIYEGDDVVKTISSNDVARMWLTTEITQAIRQGSYTPSKIEVNYRNSSISGDVPTIYANAPGATINIYGETDAGISTKVYSESDVDEQIPYGKMTATYNAATQAQLGYESDGISVTYTHEMYDMYADMGYESDFFEGWPSLEDTLEAKSFGTLETIYNKLISNKLVKLVIKGLAADDTISMNNIRLAKEMAADYYADIDENYRTQLGTNSIVFDASYAPINYTVTFDLNVPADYPEGADQSGIFLGNDWQKVKENVNVENDALPKKIYKTWSGCPEMNGWKGTTGAASYALADLLPNVTITDGAMTLVADWKTSDCADRDTIYLTYWTHDGENVEHDIKYMHGSVVLRQDIGDGDYIDHPMTTFDHDPWGNKTYMNVLPVVDDTMTFKVSATPAVGYTISSVAFTTTASDAASEIQETGAEVTLGLVAPQSGDTTLTVNTKLYSEMRFNVDFLPKTYTVDFDMSWLADDESELLLFSDFWKTTSAQTNMATKVMKAGEDFPRVYRLEEDSDYYGYVFGYNIWGAPDLDFNQDYEFFDDVLSSKVIEKAFVSDDDPLALVINEDRFSGGRYTFDIAIYADNGEGEAVTDLSAIHGSLALSQTILGKTYTQDAAASNPAGSMIFWRLRMPIEGADTMTFDVATKPEPGYEMAITNFVGEWVSEGNDGIVYGTIPEGFGYNATAKTFTFQPDHMSNENSQHPMEFWVKFTLHNYDVSFVRPTLSAPVDGEDAVPYFVTSDDAADHWADSKQFNVNSTDKTMPKLYTTAEGCIGWSAKKPFTDGTDTVFTEFDAQAVVALLMDDPTVYATYYTTGCVVTENEPVNVTVHGEHLDGVELWQFIGINDANDEDIKIDTIKTVAVKSTTDDGDVYTVKVPKVQVQGAETVTYKEFPFEVHAIPAEGYVVKDYYKIVTTGADDNIVTTNVTLENGSIVSQGADLDVYVNEVGAGPYYVVFDTTALDSIAFAWSNTVYSDIGYEIYVPSDVNTAAGAYSSFDLASDADELKLPELIAVTDARDNSGNNAANSFRLRWTFNPDSTHCEVGSSYRSNGLRYYLCVDTAYDNFSSELVWAAAAGNYVDAENKVTLYPVWSTVPKSNSYLDVAACDYHDADCEHPEDNPITIELTQSIEMGGQTYEFKHSTADKAIKLPENTGRDYVFDINFKVNPGYTVAAPASGTFTDPNVENFGYADGKFYLRDSEYFNIYQITYFAPEYGYADYDVTFQLDDYSRLVVLGNQFTATRQMNVSEESRNFPATYVLNKTADGAEFWPLLWSYKPQDQFYYYGHRYNEEIPYELKVDFKDVAYSELTSKLLENALTDDPEATGVTVYPMNPEDPNDHEGDNYQWVYSYTATVIPVYAVNEDNDTIMAADAYHGSVALSQQVNSEKTFTQASERIEVMDEYDEEVIGYNHALYIPGDINDTLTFTVAAKPDAGYVMTIKGFESSWKDYDDNEEETPADMGLVSDDVLKINPRFMDGTMKFLVQYVQQHYSMTFTRPDSDAELFVANKLVDGKYVIDWIDEETEVPVESLSAPMVYTANGCRVPWKVNATGRDEFDPTASIQEELAYMTSNEKSDGHVNALVLDVDGANSLCNGNENYFTQYLHVEGEGTIKLLQVLGPAPESEDDPAQLVITHSFSSEGDRYMDVPAAYNDNGNGDTVLTGVKFIVKVEPAEGYVLDRLTYETSKNGNFIIADLEDGDSLNILENLVFNAKFVGLAPIYVTYDLSLSSAEDSANTYLPANAETAGSIELETNADTVAFWKPYRTDKCFAGWAATSADRYMEGVDSLYQVFDAAHFEDFSTNSDNPTNLFAIWQDCSETPEPTVVLKNGSGHTTVAMYQMFGDDSLRHEITTEGISLVGDEFVFQMDEDNSKAKVGYRIAEDAEYSFTYTVAGSDESIGANRDVDHNRWYVTTENIEGVPTYAIDIATEAVEYNFVLKVEDDDVFYGSAYTSTWTPTADDFGEALPGNIYRAGKKLGGWSFGNSAEAFLNFDDDFVSAYNDYVEEVTRHDELEGPVSLYAVWEDSYETPSISMYLSSEANSAGKLALTQIVEEDTVVITVDDILEIPAVEGLAFAVNYTTDSAHSISIAEKPITLMGDFGVVAQIDNGEMVTFDDTYLNLSSIEVRVTPTVDEYEFVFDINVDEEADDFYGVYYGTNWKSTATYSMDEEGHRFPMSAYQQSNCLAGFYFEPIGPLPAGYTMTMPDVKFYTEIDSEFVADYKKLGRQLDTLYAVWYEPGERCQQQLAMVATSNAAAEGTFTLTNAGNDYTVPAAEETSALGIPVADDLEFKVTFTAGSAYDEYGENDVRIVMNRTTEYLTNGENYIFSYTTMPTTLVADVGTKAAQFALNVNVEDANVFYRNDYETVWSSQGVEYGAALPTNVYRADVVLDGWAFTADATEGFKNFDNDFMAAYANFDPAPTTLYAVWKTAQDREVWTITSKSLDAGDLTVAQWVDEDSIGFAVGSEGLAVPAEEGLRFNVYFAVNNTHTLAGLSEPLTILDSDEASLATIANGDWYEVTGDIKVEANTSTDAYEFVFNENANGATLFYGENWSASLIVDMADAEASRTFPTSLYRTDKCLEGFAFEDSDPTVTYRELSEAFVTRFKTEDYSSPLTLYAVWGDCSEPRATYTITVANDATEGKFVLTNSFGDEINNEYELDNLSSLVVPAEEDLKFKVVFAENAAFDYSGKVDVYDAASTETALARVNDGETYIFTGAAETQQLHAVVELKTKTFVLKVEDDHAFYPSDFGGFEWTPTNYGDTIPTNIYFAGFKTVGWHIGDVVGYHTKFDNDFVEAYKQSLESGETPEESDTLYLDWAGDDETGTYTIYFDSYDVGTITLKNVAPGIENEFQVGGGLEVPAKENLVFSVTFESDYEHTIKNGRPIKLVDVNGTIIDSIANGGTFELTQTTHIAVETAEDVYHFAFDANAAAGDTVFYGTNWYSEKDYEFTGDRYFYFPTAAYQTGKCLAGFALDAAGTGDTFWEINDDFIRAYRAIEGTKPSTLYAVWTTPDSDSDCDPQVVTVKTNNTVAEGAFTLVNGDNSYSVSDEEIAVPYAADLAFTVQFTAGHAYHLLYDVDIRVMDEYGNIKSYPTNGAEFQFYANTILNADVHLNSAGLVLSSNADAVFYGRDYNPDVMEGHDLPSELYRTNAVFMGWSFKKGFAEGEPVLTTWNDDFNRAYKKHVESRETFDTPDTLYALWTPSSNRETVTVSVENKASEGSMRFTNVSYGYSEEFFVAGGSSIVIPKESDLEFEVDFISESDKVEYTYINVVSPNGTINEMFWMGQTRTFLEDARLKAQSEIGSLELVLNVNAGDANVFYGRDFEFRWWGSSYGEELPKGIYRTDAKLVGWSFKKNATASEAYKEIDDQFVEEYEAYMQNLEKVYEQRMKEFEAYMSSLSPAELAKLDQYAFEEYQMKFFEDVYPVLYAVWDTKATVPTHTLVSNSLKQGTLTIVQQVSDSTFAYVVGKDGLKIPTALDDEIFAMGHFEPNPSWLLMGNRPLVWASASGADTTENDFYGDLNEMPKSLTFSVIAKYIGFHLVFNVNSKDSLFFGDDWKSEGDFIATAEETMLPAMVYNSDRCLEGWSVKPDSKTSYTVMGDALADELYATYPNLDDTTKVNLYARFTDSLELCAGELTRIAIEQDKGSVMLVENTGSGEAVHKFNDKGTMLIPMDIVSLEWTVRSVPDSSYELGSVSITRNEKVMAILHEGEHLPGNLEGALLTAVFEKSNKTPIQVVDTSFVQSGNAIQLSFKASDFEVTRGVSARVQLIDMATDAVVVDSLLGDSVAMGYADDVVLRVSRTGNYKVALILEDSLEVAEYAREFSVVNEIASIDVDSWQMLSIAAVDTSKIDTADQIFYWWDEVGGTGEFWLYKQFSVGDSIVATRGAWYNSLEGKPLVLRKDIEDDGKDIVWNLDSVNTGWNLVANTHGWAVDLYSYNADQRKDVDEESDVTFWRYNAKTGDYDSVLTMQPYEAVWAKVTKKTTWNISAKPVFEQESDTVDTDSVNIGDPENPLLLKRVLAKTSTKERWTLQAVLSDRNGKRDAWNILGAGPNPFNAEEPPESMGDHVNLSIVEGKRAFAKSIKPHSDDMEWTVSLSASTGRIGYLSLVGIEGVKAYGYRVYVTVDGNTTEMQEGSPLKVYLKESAKTATVRVVPATRVVAESSLKGLRMARLGGKLQVSFDATGLAGTNARVDLLDMKGHVMATVAAKTVEGSNALVLDAPKSGLYMLRVRAGSQQQATKVMVK